MLRALFLEYPEDPSCWLVEDQYFFGSDFLVAPIFEENTLERNIYLPPGSWIDYHTGKQFSGAKWIKIKSEKLPGVLLVKEDAAIPHIKVEQSTAFINWENIEWRVFSYNEKEKDALLFKPGQQEIQKIKLKKTTDKWQPAGKLNEFF